MPRLVKMFKDSPKDDWIRQPVASFVLVAAEQPGDVGERAKATIAELEALDPETVERARSLSAFSFLANRARVAATWPGKRRAGRRETPGTGSSGRCRETMTRTASSP